MQPFTYLKVATASEAVSAMRSAPAGSSFLAGGTTLYDLMKLGAMKPPMVIDIRGIPELATLRTQGTELVIGAGMSMADVAADPTVRTQYPALAESLWKAASQQIRNMASVGGNLLQRTRCPYFRGGDAYPCNKRQPGSGCAAIGGVDRQQAVLGTSAHCTAAYPGDWAVALVAFDAVVDAVGPRGRRSLALEQLYREPGTTPHLEHQLAADELIASIRVPLTPAGRASTYHKVRDRESYAFALSSAAVALELEAGRVREARIAVGGIAARPWRARAAEQSLVGRAVTVETAAQAGQAAMAGARPGKHNAFRVELGARTVAEAIFIAARRGGLA